MDQQTTRQEETLPTPAEKANTPAQTAQEEDLLRLENDMNAPVREEEISPQQPSPQKEPEEETDDRQEEPDDEDEEEEEEEEEVSDEPPPVQEGERFRITVHLVAKDYLASMMFNYYINGWYNTVLAILVFFVGLGSLFFGSYIVSIICLLYPFVMLLINRIRFSRYCKKTYVKARVFDLIGNDEIGFLVYSHQTGKTSKVTYPEIKSVIETKHHYLLTAKQNRFQIIFPKRETPKTAVYALKNLLREKLTYQQYRFKKEK